MKKIISSSGFNMLMLSALCAVLFSFSVLPGAHRFQVFLDSKMVLDQYVNSKVDAPSLRLDPSAHHRQLIVKYSECGRTVSGRKLIIQDKVGTPLKEWKFDGTSAGLSEAMTCEVNDVLKLKQKGSDELNLVYASSDFSRGQLIAHLLIGSEEGTK